jgi:hypothetical protein
MSLERMLRDEEELFMFFLQEEFHMQESIVIRYHEEDFILHTEGRPFCYNDPQCPCREDKDNINLLNDLIEQGLLTKDEAALIMRGATI